MKKLLLTATISLVCLSASAQLHIHAGANYSGILKANNESIGYKPGFQAGITYDMGKFLVFQPGLFFSQKGYTVNFGNHIDASANTRINYLEIPLNLMIRFGFDNIKFHGGVGATFGYGIWGRQTFTLLGQEISQKIAFDGKETTLENMDKAHLKPFDIGGNIFVGVSLWRLGITLGYNPSFTNISTFDQQDIKNQRFYLGLSMRLGPRPEDKY